MHSWLSLFGSDSDSDSRGRGGQILEMWQFSHRLPFIGSIFNIFSEKTKKNIVFGFLFVFQPERETKLKKHFFHPDSESTSQNINFASHNRKLKI
jgi:hypothetical protein